AFGERTNLGDRLVLFEQNDGLTLQHTMKIRVRVFFDFFDRGVHIVIITTAWDNLPVVHYQLKITLRDIDPLIWRRVLVPSQFTLFELHRVIQIAMGWEDDHLHDFTIDRRRYALPSEEDFDEPIDEGKTRLAQVVRTGSKLLYQYDFGDSWEHAI